LARFTDKDVWEIKVGKNTFELTGLQARVLKEASVKGHRGLIWFDDFAVSIPHIEYIENTIFYKGEDPLIPKGVV